MSMSTSVIGFIPPDEKFQKMLAAYQACIAAGTNPPKEVRDFFGDGDPDPAGLEIDLVMKKYKDAVKPYHDEMEDGYEIDLRKLPADIKIIRVVNSW